MHPASQVTPGDATSGPAGGMAPHYIFPPIENNMLRSPGTPAPMAAGIWRDTNHKHQARRGRGGEPGEGDSDPARPAPTFTQGAILTMDTRPPVINSGPASLAPGKGRENYIYSCAPGPHGIKTETRPRRPAQGVSFLDAPARRSEELNREAKKPPEICGVIRRHQEETGEGHGLPGSGREPGTKGSKSPFFLSAEGAARAPERRK